MTDQDLEREVEHLDKARKQLNTSLIHLMRATFRLDMADREELSKESERVQDLVQSLKSDALEEHDEVKIKMQQEQS